MKEWIAVTMRVPSNDFMNTLARHTRPKTRCTEEDLRKTQASLDSQRAVSHQNETHSR